MTYQEALRQERHAKHLLENAYIRLAKAEYTYETLFTGSKKKEYGDLQKAKKDVRQRNTEHIKAHDALAKARAMLPPPKPNAQVLATALQHTAKRDGLGWGFEHTAIEQDIAYRKWLKKASKQPSDLE